MSDGLTLEKARVVERLGMVEDKLHSFGNDINSIDKKLEVLISEIKFEKEYNKEILKQIKENNDKLNKTVFGNGEIGLVGKVDKLNEFKNHIIGLWTAVVIGTFKVIIDMLHGK